MSDTLASAGALGAPDERAAVRVAAAPCLIVNPRSFRASRGLAARASARARELGAEVVEVRSPAELEAALDAIVARRQRRVLVLAGDGTVQAVVDRFARAPHGSWAPDLLVLPGGRTNLTAADLAPGMGALPLIERALDPARAERWDACVQARAVLRIEQAPAPARYGFFVAGALVDDVIRRVHAYRTAGEGPLHRGRLSVPWSLLRLAALALAGRSGMRCPDLAVDAGGIGRLAGPMRVLLASTLEHATGTLDPYAGRGTGALRVTAATHRAAGFWRRLPCLLTGHFTEAMRPSTGWLSGRCERIEITGLARYMLDGEPFDADPSRVVTISSGPRLRFAMP